MCYEQGQLTTIHSAASADQVHGAFSNLSLAEPPVQTPNGPFMRVLCSSQLRELSRLQCRGGNGVLHASLLLLGQLSLLQSSDQPPTRLCTVRMKGKRNPLCSYCCLSIILISSALCARQAKVLSIAVQFARHAQFAHLKVCAATQRLGPICCLMSDTP